MPRVGLTSTRLATAGAEVADAMGFDAVTVSRVARHVGVKPASLYSHLTGSDDLRTKVCLLALSEMAEGAADALAGRAGREALAAYAESFRSYARRHPGRYEASHRRLDPATAEASDGRRHTDLAVTILRGYAVPESEHVHAVRLLGSSIHGFVSLEAAGGFSHSAPDAEASWTRAIDALDHVLRGWPAP
ncbi:TetR/AcrR family transcriptional regulator [Aeromicrobium sp. CTD01-1L150]|uniref:TetR/AcrR family transcriptional regulator n=1 Tax=Aeromicrobium sp. CTD01-1L150 TaxID=3341830 RepID=UPI0035BEFB4B